MLAKLAKAEKSPNQGWITLPRVVQENEEQTEESGEDEVLFIDDPKEEYSGKGARNKQCFSESVRNPREYQCGNKFKIPKFSCEIKDCYSSSSTLSTSQNHGNANKWIQSSFGNVNNGKKIMDHSDKDFQAVTNVRGRMERHRNPIEPSTNQWRCTRRSKIISKRPFDDEINSVMGKSQRAKGVCNSTGERACNRQTIRSPQPKQISPSVERNRRSVRLKEIQLDGCVKLSSSFNNVIISEDSSKDDDSENEKLPGNNGKTKRDSVTNGCGASLIDSDQFITEIYEQQMKEINSASNDSDAELDKQKKLISTKCNCKELGEPNETCLHCKQHSFPSLAATPRPPLHDAFHVTSSTGCSTNSFYGSGTQRKPAALKTYGITKKSKIKGNLGGLNTVKTTKDESSECTSEPESDKIFTGTKKRKNNKNDKTKTTNNDNQKSSKRKKADEKPEVFLIDSSGEEDNSGSEKDGKSSKEVNTTQEQEERTKTTIGENLLRSASTVDNPFERDSFAAEILLGPKVLIGILEGIAKGPLEILTYQLKWKMEYKDKDFNKPTTVLIHASDLTSFKIHTEDPKIIMLGITHGGALKLGGKFGNGRIIDPGSAVESEHNIILQVNDSLTAEMMADLNDWITQSHNKTLQDLSLTEAEKLMDRFSSTKSEGKKTLGYYNTRSIATRTSSINSNALTPTRMIVYPCPPLPGGITVTSADLSCLAEGEFLNDVIIDFYLKYIYHDILSESDKKRTHIFSSFFYKRLTQKGSNSSEFFESVQDRMHSQVKKWTRNVDIFDKDFIIVPINESSHWYLAIICYPNLDEPIIEESSSQESEESGQEDDENEICVDDDEKSSAAVDVAAKVNKKPQAIIKACPCILIFDSLGNSKHMRVTINLRNYLSCEWKQKKPTQRKREFSKDHIKGAFPKVPEQDNHCDCGIFVLQYAESFFKNPIRDYKTPIHRPTWFLPATVATKRQAIKKLINDLRDKAKPTSS